MNLFSRLCCGQIARKKPVSLARLCRLIENKDAAVQRLDGECKFISAKGCGQQFIFKSVVEVGHRLLDGCLIRKRDRAGPGFGPLVDEEEDLARILVDVAAIADAVVHRSDRDIRDVKRTQLCDNIGERDAFSRRNCTFTEAEAFGGIFNVEDREAGLGELFYGSRERIRYELSVRDEKRPVVLGVHMELVLIDAGAEGFPVGKDVGRQDIVVDLRVCEGMADLIRGHMPAGPVGFPVVEDGDGRDVAAAVQELRDTVRIGHERPEMAVLGVVAAGVEMRRAVRIRIFHRAEGVRDKVVDAAHEEVVGQVFFEPYAFLPAVVSEDLAHGAAGLFGLDGCRGVRELPEEIMVELAVSVGENVIVVGDILALREDLTSDVVDAGHILSPEAAEIVAQRGARAGVVVVVLDEVADVFHAALAAPVPDLLREILPDQAGDGVHVGVAKAGGLLRIGVLNPHEGKELLKVCAETAAELFLEFRAPGIVHAREPVGVVGVVEVAVAELRFVGEEAGDGFPELLLVVLVVRLVDRVDEDAAGGAVHHVDVGGMVAVVARKVQKIDGPAFGGCGPVQFAVLNISLQVDGCPVTGMISAYGIDPVIVKCTRRCGHRVLLGHVFFPGSRVIERFPGEGKALAFFQRERAAGQTLTAQLIRFVQHRAVRIAGRKMTVVEDPDLHPELFSLIEDDVHIAPPFGAAEVRVRAAFDADGADIGLVDHVHVVTQDGFLLAVLPEERKDVVSALIVEKLLDFLRQHVETSSSV